MILFANNKFDNNDYKKFDGMDSAIHNIVQLWHINWN